MSSQLLDSLRTVVPADAVAPLAARLGEPTAATDEALAASFGVILAGLVALLPDATSMHQAHDLVTVSAGDPPLLDDVGGYLGGAPRAGAASGAGEAFLSAIFGGRALAASEVVARASGVHRGAAAALLATAAPLVLAVLARRVSDGGLDVAGLTTLLASQKDRILRDAPPGTGSALGISEIPRVAVAAAAAGRTGPATAGAWKPGKAGWLWPVTAAAALIALLLVLARNREVEPVSTTLGDDAVGAMSEAAATAAVAASGGATVRRRLADGNEVLIPPGGLEDDVIGFIEDPNRLVDRTTWFTFDRLSFESGSATIRAESREQLGRLGTILGAYPAVRVKIGGYTDSVGDRGANERLSRDRANAVRDALIAIGVERDRIEAEGYGEQFPAADNGTEEGRARNRRIALRVTAK